MNGDTWLAALLWTSFYGSLLALAVLALGPVLRRQLPARWRFALWLLVLVRFAPLPMPGSRVSMWNWVPASKTAVVRTVPEAPAPSAPVREAAIAAPEVPLAPEAAGVVPADGRAVVADMPPASSFEQRSEAAPTTGHAVPWNLLFQGVYLTGAAVILLRLGLATRSLRRVIRGAVPVKDVGMLALLRSVQEILGIKGTLPLLATQDLGSPALAGFWQPRLLMPAELLGVLSVEELRLVFMHEVAHLRRRDVLVNYGLAVVEIVHWFNPLVWLILPRVRAERELACDEMVLLHTADPAPYGHALLKLFESAGPARALAPAVGIVESGPFFARRIRMIANFKRRPAWLALPVLLAAAVTGAFVMTGPRTLAQTAVQTPAVNGPPTMIAVPGTLEVTNGVVAAPGTPGVLMMDAPAGGVPTAVQFNVTATPTPAANNDADVIAAKLAAPLKEFRFTQVPLGQVIDLFAKDTGLNVHVNWKSLGAMGVSPETAVSAQLSDVPARKALQLVLDDVAGVGGVTYLLDDGVVTISTAAEINLLIQRNGDTPMAVPNGAGAPVPADQAELRQRLIDLQRQADMLSVPGGPAVDLEALHKQLAQTQAQLAAVAGKPRPTALRVYDVHELLDVPAGQQSVLTADQQSAMKDLVETLKTTLADPACTISAFNGMVIVTAPPELHDKVTDVLDNLNQAHRRYLEDMRARAEHAAQAHVP